MRLEKVMIDGEVYYREIADEEDGEVPEDSVSDDSQQTSVNYDEWLDRLGQGIRRFHKKAKVRMKDFYGRIKSGAGRLLKRRETTKEEELLGLLPYMDEEGRHAVLLRILETPDVLLECDVESMLPDFTQKDRDVLILFMVEHYPEVGISDIVKYASEECLSCIVGGFLDGKFPGLDIHVLYPYLKKEDVRRLYGYFAKPD